LTEPFHVLVATSGMPLFLRHQVELLRRYSDTEPKIVVVNDAKEFADPSNWGDARAAASITEVCAELKVECLRYPQSQHWRRLRPPRISPPSWRTGEAIQLGFDSIRARAGSRYLGIIDSDMFPFRPFSFQDMLSDHAMAIIPQTRHNSWFPGIKVYHPWNGFLLMDLQTLPREPAINFNPGLVKGIRTDTGGKIHHYIAAHPSLRIKHLQHLPSGGWRIDDHPALGLPRPLKSFVANDPANRDGNAFCEIYEESFLHLRAGSNWQGVLGDHSDHFLRRHRQFSAALEAMSPSS
jgi:hypothetical protein